MPDHDWELIALFCCISTAWAVDNSTGRYKQTSLAAKLNLVDGVNLKVAFTLISPIVCRAPGALLKGNRVKGFVSSNFGFMLQGKPDIVQPVKQTVAGEGVNLESGGEAVVV